MMMLNPKLRKSSELPPSRSRTPDAMTSELAKWKLEHHQHELRAFRFHSLKLINDLLSRCGTMLQSMWDTTVRIFILSNHSAFTSGTEFGSTLTCILVQVLYDQPCPIPDLSDIQLTFQLLTDLPFSERIPHRLTPKDIQPMEVEGVAIYNSIHNLPTDKIHKDSPTG